MMNAIRWKTNATSLRRRNLQKVRVGEIGNRISYDSHEGCDSLPFDDAPAGFFNKMMFGCL